MKRILISLLAIFGASMMFSIQANNAEIDDTVMSYIVMDDNDNMTFDILEARKANASEEVTRDAN